MTAQSQKQTESRQILNSFRRLVQVLQNYSKSLESDLGVSGAQLFVLKKVSESGACSINDIAEKTLTHQSSVSVVVDRLVQKALVERQKDPNDKRRVLIALSPKGKKLISQAESTPQEKLAKSILKLPDSRRRDLAVTLSALMKTAGFASKEPDLFFETDKKGKS